MGFALGEKKRGFFLHLCDALYTKQVISYFRIHKIHFVNKSTLSGDPV